MADTITSLKNLQTLLADNNSKNISPQDVRDFLISTHLKMCTTTAVNYSATENDTAIILDASNSAISLTLPTCTAGNAGQMFMIKAINCSANKPYITNNVDGAAWTFGSSNESLITAGDGTNWKQISTNKYPVMLQTSVSVITATAAAESNIFNQTVGFKNGGLLKVDFKCDFSFCTSTAMIQRDNFNLYIDGVTIATSFLINTKLTTTGYNNISSVPLFGLKTLGAATTHSITVSRVGGGGATYPQAILNSFLRYEIWDLG